MNVVKVLQKWPTDKLRIEMMIGNTCNYKCWYCFPGSNEGTHRWPEYEKFKINTHHLLTYYKQHLEKNTFEIHFVGGEPTLWPELGDYVKYLKENFNVITSMSTNGSRTLRWWKEYGKYFDKVIISCHYESIDVSHICDVGDILYDQNVIVTGLVLMDPDHWDQCWNIVEELKKSKRSWGIDLQEIYVRGKEINYSQEQIKLLKKFRFRQINLFHFLKNNKHTLLRTSVEFEDGNKKKVKNNEIILNKWNKFKGWDCNLGIDSIFISKEGFVTGACGEKLYNLDFRYNIMDQDFPKKFTPKLSTTTCYQENCWCQPESNLNKTEINSQSIKKIIPIMPA